MAESSGGVASQRGSQVKRYAFLFVVIITVVGVLCAISFYGEDIKMVIKLRAWDRGAPGHVVTSFLEAAKRGDAAEADRYIDSSAFQPLKKNDKAVGYFVATPAGTMDFLFGELAPEGNVKITSVDFVLLGEGAADVKTAWKANENSRFRLKMRNGTWKITEILDGGRMRGR